MSDGEAKKPFQISNKPSLFYHLAILPSFSDNLLPHLTVSHHYGTFSVSSPPVHGIVAHVFFYHIEGPDLFFSLNDVDSWLEMLHLPNFM
ncbi:hypothetical protein AAZX31_03G164700 [Glycine max]